MTEFTPEMMEAMKRLAAPSDGHGQLEHLAGEWDTETNMWLAPGMDPITTQGTASGDWILGGRFLAETLHGHGPDGSPYEGLSIVGYNNLAKRHEGMWISDGMTPMTQFTGTSLEDGDGVVYAGTETDPTGQGPDREFTMERRIDSPDQNRLTMHYRMPDDSMVKSFEIVYRRAAPGDADG